MDKALLAKVEKQAWFHRHPRGWPMFLFFIVMAGTCLGIFAIERAEGERLQQELDGDATEIASALQRKAAERIAILHASAAFFATRDRVPRWEFHEFISDLRARNDILGSVIIGWVERFDAASIPQLELDMLLQGQVGYKVHPAPAAGNAEVAPIVYLEPESRANRSAFGFDMLSNPVRRSAIEGALSKEPTVSGKLRLIEARLDPRATGVLMIVPVYGSNALQPRVKGFVYIASRTDDFLQSVTESYRHGNVELAIYDEVKRPDRLIAQRLVPGRVNASLDRIVRVGNREWVLSVSFKKDLGISPLSQATLYFGTVLALLAMFIGRLITRRAAEDREVLEWLTRQAAIRDALARELSHRVKNTLANVISIVSLSRPRASDADDLAKSVIERVRALSATQDLLVETGWKHARIGDVIASELSPYVELAGQRLQISGPDAMLAPNDALNFGLAIHELVTNAAKYGALTREEGRIHIHWTLPSPDIAEVHWREENGPPVQVPTRRGFGLELIEKIVSNALHSPVNLEFKPEGVECRLRLPIRQATEFMLREPGPP